MQLSKIKHPSIVYVTLQRYFPNNVILSDRRERRISFLAGNSSL